MVEGGSNAAGSGSADASESPQAVAHQQPAGIAATGSDARWETTSQPMDAEEEAALMAFLTKVQGACKNDSSVQGFVGQ